MLKYFLLCHLPPLSYLEYRYDDLNSINQLRLWNPREAPQKVGARAQKAVNRRCSGVWLPHGAEILAVDHLTLGFFYMKGKKPLEVFCLHYIYSHTHTHNTYIHIYISIHRIFLKENKVSSSLNWRWQHTPVFLPGKSHGQKSQVGYSTWELKSRTGLSD